MKIYFGEAITNDLPFGRIPRLDLHGVGNVVLSHFHQLEGGFLPSDVLTEASSDQAVGLTQRIRLGQMPSKVFQILIRTAFVPFVL